MKQVPFEAMMPLINEAFASDQTITISVTGTSMMPTFRPHDAVTLKKAEQSDLQRGDVVLYRRADGSYILHRLVAVHADSLDFCGDAQYTVEKGVSKDAVIAVVCSREEDGKTVDRSRIRREGKRRLCNRVFRRVQASMDRRFGKEEKNPMYTPMRFIGRYVKKHVLGIVLLCVLSGVMALAMLGMAVISGLVIDKVMSKEMNNFSGWFILLFVLLLVVVVTNFISSNLRARVTSRLKNEMREDIFDRLLKKRFHDVQSLHSGDILTRMTSDIYLVSESAVTLIPQVISLAVKLIGGIGFMMFVDPMFTSLVIVGGAVIVCFMQLFSRRFKRMHKEFQEAEGRCRSFLQECVENLVVIKSFNNEQGVMKSFGRQQEIAYDRSVRRAVISSFGNSIVYAGFTMAYYAALAWGILRVAGWFGPEAFMTFGTFMSFLQIMEQIRTPFRTASGVLPQLYSMIASAERLEELTLLRNERVGSTTLETETVYRDMRALCFNDVSFAYERDNPIFRDKTLVFKKGALTAIVGPSGAGKTTMVKLLLGLESPQKGCVEMTMQDGTSVTVDASTRTLFSYVPQGNMILSGTIAENIRFGIEDVPDEELWRAVKLACLEHTIMSLPKGLDTVIGERGVGLSEGQIQRLAVARALLSRAPILLLDECTSALDAPTEKQLIANLKELSDHTILFISHRTAVLDNADAIVAIEDLRSDTR